MDGCYCSQTLRYMAVTQTLSVPSQVTATEPPPPRPQNTHSLTVALSHQHTTPKKRPPLQVVTLLRPTANCCCCCNVVQLLPPNMLPKLSGLKNFWKAVSGLLATSASGGMMVRPSALEKSRGRLLSW